MGLDNPNSPLMQVGNEKPTGSPQGENPSSTSSTLVSDAWDRYITWLVGMAISFIPVIAFPIYLCFNNTINSVSAFWAKVFYQSDILYMVISLAISALNDASANLPKSFFKWWQKIIWFLIVLGAVIFGILTIVENTTEGSPNSSALWFNSIFFFISLVVGSVPYVTSIIDAKKIAKGGV